MIALPHILFALTIGALAVVAFALTADTDDMPLALGQSVLLGLLGGGVLCLVIP